MPELPEVEVVKRGLQQEIGENAKIIKFEFRRKDLRHKIPISRLKKIEGESILSIERRAKYLLFATDSAGFISHLGMTGTWRVLEHKDDLGAHDHILLHILTSANQTKVLVYRDPRRFGVFDYWQRKSEKLQWGGDLGPEPLLSEFNADYLFKKSRKRHTPIKTFIMDQKIVVGVGNIYASESLFLSGISPTKPAGKLSRVETQRLVLNIQQVLHKAIAAGGSSIRDFRTFHGDPGGYHLQHFVYDRAGEQCRKCNTTIRSKVLAGRSTFWCPGCQG